MIHSEQLTDGQYWIYNLLFILVQEKGTLFKTEAIKNILWFFNKNQKLWLLTSNKQNWLLWLKEYISGTIGHYSHHQTKTNRPLTYFFIWLPPEFLPVSGPLSSKGLGFFTSEAPPPFQPNSWDVTSQQNAIRKQRGWVMRLVRGVLPCSEVTKKQVISDSGRSIPNSFNKWV